ncbi:MULTISPECIES: zonular occludens toxin domain-containing protein [Methylobacter]
MAGIIGLAGQPRSGKSYSSIELFVSPCLKEGRHIVTNLPLKMDVILQDFPDARVTFIDDLVKHDWDSVGNGVMLIIDEVWRLWPQGQKMTAIPHSQLALLKEHGHRSDDTGRSMDIVLITQDMADLCAPVRALIETTIITAKHLDLGREDSFIRYTCRKAASLGKDNTPPKNQLVSSENGRYSENVYRYYKTHMHSQGNAAPNEKRVVSSSFFNSWKFKAGLAVMALCLVGMVWGVSATQEKVQKMNDKAKPAKAATAVPAAQLQDATVPVNVPPVSAKPAYSTEWRIAGKITGVTGHLIDKVPMVILMMQSGNTRLISAKKCKREDYEDYCEIEGEIVTRFTGHKGGYIKDDSLPAQVASN